MDCSLFINKFQPYYFKDFEMDHDMIDLLKTFITIKKHKNKIYEVKTIKGIINDYFLFIFSLHYICYGAKKYE